VAEGAFGRVSLREVREEPWDDRPASRTPSVDEAFRTYARYVAAIGLRMLGRPDEVDDLVQDVFVEAQKGFRSIRDPEGVKRWLGRVAVRVAHRRLQRRRRWSFIGVHVLGTEYDYSVLPDTGASPETRALLARVYRALDALPADQRIAWTLRHVQGERLDEVALMCDCSLATAKRRIAAAHDALLEAVGDG
jgi:RNA polymerase sigma-70 factor, ECF subfamily